jgi:hypothetical protein
MKLSSKKTWFLGAAALATLGFTGLFAHASSNTPASETGDHLFPNNSISIGQTTAGTCPTGGTISTFCTKFTVPAGVTGAPTVVCKHNTAAVKTPNTKAGVSTATPLTLAAIPPAFDNGPAGAATPAPCLDQFSNTYVTVTSGTWTATVYDCPTAVTTCTEAAEPNTDALYVNVPHDGAVLTSSNGCTIKVNDHSSGNVPIKVPGTYTEGNGQLKVNVTSTTAGIPVTIVQTTGGPTCPLVTGAVSCAGQTPAVCSSFVGIYTFGITGFPKLSDN